MHSFAELESNVLREAFEDEVIDPVFPVFDNIDSKVFEWAIANHERQKYWQNDPQFAPQTQRYVESVLPLYKPTNLITSDLIELARIGVPRGSVGYLKSIEQFLQDSESDFYPTSSQYWGLPYHDISDVSNCRWFLRLEEFTGILPPRLIYTNVANFDPEPHLPGFPNWDLSEFRDIWFPPHCAAKFPNLVIPGGYMLRFFFYSPLTEVFHWQVMGKLRASLQSALCVEAQYNTRINSW